MTLFIDSPSQPFQARWTPSLADFIPREQTGNSGISFRIHQCYEWILCKPRETIIRHLILPSSKIHPDLKNELWHDIHDGFYSFRGHKKEIKQIKTPDGIDLRVITYLASNQEQNTPTVICFNPNQAIACMQPCLEAIALYVERARCNIVFFDYRGTGDSSGICKSPDDLIIDGASVVQFVQKELKTAPQQIHFYGWSLGGAIAAQVKALSPQLSGKFVNDRSFSSIGEIVIRKTSSKIANQFFYLVGKITQIIIQWLKIDCDVKPALSKLKGPILALYHPKDEVIPEAAAFHHLLDQNNSEHQKGEINCGWSEFYHAENLREPLVQVNNQPISQVLEKFFNEEAEQFGPEHPR